MSVALIAALAPFRALLDDPLVEEISVNGAGPEKVFVSRGGQVDRASVSLDADALGSLCDLVSNYNRKRLDMRSPVLSGVLPGGERVELSIPPCTPEAAISIRCPRSRAMSLDDLAAAGAFAGTRVVRRERSRQIAPIPGAERAAAEGDVVGLLRAIIAGHRNFLVSGATFSGKTTLLKALCRTIPAAERVISLEETRELTFFQPNHVHMVTVDAEPGVAETGVGMLALLRSAMRRCPDRLILGEIRGAEAYVFLNAANTGHPGSGASIHADSNEDAQLRFVQCAMEFSEFIPFDRLLTLVDDYVDVFIHIKRALGRRYVEEVLWL
jgi:type IV secretion system protein VirB11